MIKRIIFLMVITTAGLSDEAMAQSKKEEEVAIAVEQLRKAMIDPDSAILAHLVFNELSYGHSGGFVQDKKAFIHSFTSGESDFVSIELTDQTIKVIDKTAIVHHVLVAKTNDRGTPGSVKLAVMYTWVKERKQWKLLSRQAVKV